MPYKKQLLTSIKAAIDTGKKMPGALIPIPGAQYKLRQTPVTKGQILKYPGLSRGDYRISPKRS